MLRPASLLTREVSPDGSVVVAKQLRPEDAGRQDLALRLANEAAVLQHLAGMPGVIPLLGLRHNPLTLVLPFADGGSLADHLENGMTPTARHDAAVALIDAVSGCHGRGVVHRDIKPSNILFIGPTLLLADFGVAAWGVPRRALPEGWEEDAIGTPPWSAPELRRHATGQVEPSVDVYALGKTLIALLGECSAALVAACDPDPDSRPALEEIRRGLG